MAWKKKTRFFQVDVYFVFYIFSAIFGSMMGRLGSKGEDMEEQWHAAAAGKTSKVLRRQSLQELLHKKTMNNEYSFDYVTVCGHIPIGSMYGIFTH